MSPGQAHASAAEGGQRTSVLVVDDNPHLLKALRIKLQAHGYAVDTAADGGTALRAASHRPPDLVVLDLGGATCCPSPVWATGFCPESCGETGAGNPMNRG